MMTDIIIFILVLMAGFLAASKLSPKSQGIKRLALALFISCFVPQYISIITAFILGSILTKGIFIFSLLLIIVLSLPKKWSFRWTKSDTKIALCSILVGVIWIMNFNPGWIIDDYVPREHELGSFRLIGAPRLTSSLPENLICHSSSTYLDCPQICSDPLNKEFCLLEQKSAVNNSIETKTLGVAVFLSSFLLLFGLSGLYVAMFILAVMLAMFSFLLARKFALSENLSMLLLLAFTLNPFTLNYIYFSSNLLSLLLFIAVLYTYSAQIWLLLGAASAILLTTRPEFVFLFPILFYDERKKLLKKAIIFSARYR